MKKLANFYIKHRSEITKAALLASAAISQSAFAQKNAGEELLTEATNSMKELANGFVTVIQIGMLIGALVTLVLAIINVMKGEREAATKIAWWVIGLTVGFAFITIIKNYILKV